MIRTGSTLEACKQKPLRGESTTEFLCRVAGSSRGLAEAFALVSLGCLLALTILFLQVRGGSLLMWSSGSGEEPAQMLSPILQFRS